MNFSPVLNFRYFLKDEELVGVPIRVNYSLIDLLWVLTHRRITPRRDYSFIKKKNSSPSSIRFSVLFFS